MTNEIGGPLYLSRLHLNPDSRQVISELAHPYEMHRTLMRAFPRATNAANSKAREEFGVLFRADVDDLRGLIKVYIQSRIKPDWSLLDKSSDYFLMDSGTPVKSCKDIMPVFKNLHTGQTLYFRLRANPTKRSARPDDPLKGKRVELQQEADQIDWLIRKGRGSMAGVSGGFDLLIHKISDNRGEIRTIPRINVCFEGKQKSRKKDEGLRHSATHLAVRFDGLLRITDKNAFLASVIKGIGSGKAFGFGLMTVAPVLSEEA